MLLTAERLFKSYGDKTVLSGVSLMIGERDRLGLVGPNGAGKTTLLRILTGREEPDIDREGDGVLSIGANVSIGYLDQMGGLDSTRTVWDEMRTVFSDLLDAAQRMHEIEEKMAFGESEEEEREEYHQIQTWFESREGYQIDVKIEKVLRGMGFLPDVYSRTIDGFSGGEKTRLAIAKLLLEEPNLLILDEPTNHLDFHTVMWLEDYLRDYRGTLLLVSHDRYFLDRLCTGILDLDRGKLTRYKGNYTAYTSLKEQDIARAWKEYEAQQREIEKKEEYIRRNGVRASTAKSAQSRQKQLDKMERLDRPTPPPKKARVDFTFENDPPLEILSVTGADVSVGTGSQRRTLIEPMDFTVYRGEKWGIIGDNGVGKSTLLKEIQNLLPHTGRIRWAAGVKIGYFDQEAKNLSLQKTVFDEIHDRVPLWGQGEVRSLLGRVRITGDEVFERVGVLSGGERAKLGFAVLMLEHPNVLILDEPTNHLDLTMKEIIEDALVRYTGTILFVSHDRYLLDRVADHLLILGGGEAEVFAGGFTRWQERTQKTDDTPNNPPKSPENAPKNTSSASNHRSKEDRARQAQMRAKMKECERAIDEKQAEYNRLEEEMASCADDYAALQEKCTRLEWLQREMDELLDEMIALEDGQPNA